MLHYVAIQSNPYFFLFFTASFEKIWCEEMKLVCEWRFTILRRVVLSNCRQKRNIKHLQPFLVSAKIMVSWISSSIVAWPRCHIGWPPYFTGKNEQDVGLRNLATIIRGEFCDGILCRPLFAIDLSNYRLLGAAVFVYWDVKENPSWACALALFPHIMRRRACVHSLHSTDPTFFHGVITTKAWGSAAASVYRTSRSY